MQKHNGFPDNKVISEEFNNKEELSKHKKKVMPFVVYLKEQVQKKGISALNSTLDFNELDVLNINHKYLVQTLLVYKNFKLLLLHHL